MSKKTLKVSIFEIVWYSICGAIALWGITYIVLGLVGDHLPITAEDNALSEASDAIKVTFGLGFFHWGLILTGVAAAAAIVVLLLNAKKSDREVEKAARRAARLVRNETPVVDAEVSEK